MRTTRTGVRSVLAGIAAATVLALTACANHQGAPSDAAADGAAPSASKPATMTTVNVGITGATAPPTFLPLVAQKFGLDTKNNLKINFVTIAPNVTAQTLSQGSVDILAAPSVESAMVKGAPFQIIAGAALSYWHVVAANGVSDWSDLKGKKIALPCGVGATCVAFMAEALKSHGLSSTSVTFINGTAQGTYESLAAGSVDAALTTAPYTYALFAAGKTHEFDISKTAPYLSTEFTAKTAYVKANPAVISAFVETMGEAVAAISASPLDPKVLEAIDAFEKQNGIDPATLDQKRFLAEFATDNSWQLVPTKALIARDLELLAEADPQVADQTKAATFENLVYQVPQFKGKYE